MKTTIKNLLCATTVATIVLVGCKKETEVVPTNTPNAPTSVNSVWGQISSKKATKQTFTIDASQYQMITGAKGTKLHFSPNSFKTASGQAVTGAITIELREMYTKADMLFNNAPTVSGGQMLISGGELFVQALQNGQELKLSSPYAVSAQMPVGNNVGPMQEFYVNGNYESVFEPNSERLDWSSTGQSFDSTYTETDSVFVGGDTTNNGNYVDYYNFQLDGLNWINCDYFWGNPGPFTDLEINVGSQFDGSNCTVFVSFDGMNSMASLYDWDVNNIFQYGYASLPQGVNVHIIAIGEINGQLYSSIVPATLGANFSTTLSLTTTTLSQLTNDVNALP